MKYSKITLIALITGFVFIFTIVNCDRETQPMLPNLPPNTTLANIPVDNDTLFALVTLHWDGEDGDGFVTSYKYRYTTYHVYKGDSVVTDWQVTENTRETIAFESSDSLNFQRFEVKAIDNDNAEDPTPAVKTFYTVRAYPPETSILSPEDGADLFVLSQTSDWWPGIQIIFGSSDRDGEVIEYCYRVDGQDWRWTQDTSVVILPEELILPLTGEHTVEVAAKDNTGLIDPSPASITVRLFEPTFDKNILVIDETEEGTNTPGISSDAEVDSFYQALFNPDSVWDYFDNDGLPEKHILGRYRLVVWHSDHKIEDHYLGQNTDYLIEYLQAGGKLVISGWRVIKSFNLSAQFPVVYDSDSFVAQYLHIAGANESPSIPGAFVGASGSNGYPDVKVDTTKVHDFPYFDALPNVNIFTLGAFTRTILKFNGKETMQDFNLFQDRPCAIEYRGTVFDVIVLGFPLLYIRFDDAKLFAQKIVENLLNN